MISSFTIVGAVLDDAIVKLQLIKKQIEIKIALKISVHSIFRRAAICPEKISPAAAHKIGIKSAKIPAIASFFCGSPIVTFEPFSIFSLRGLET